MRWLGAATALVLSGVSTATTPDPNAMIQDTADALYEALNGRREHFESNPAELHRLVDEILLPRFDRVYAARLVLARHWRTASNQQKKRFIEAFYEFLVRTYSKGLLEFANHPMRVLPYRPGGKDDRATVRTEVTLQDGTETPVNYSLRLTDGRWRIWDVTIEGISYVKNYRTDFNVEIRQKGLEAVIERLEDGETATDGNG